MSNVIKLSNRDKEVLKSELVEFSEKYKEQVISKTRIHHVSRLVKGGTLDTTFFIKLNMVDEFDESLVLN